MASFNVSVVSSVPIHGVVTVSALTSKDAVWRAMELHREARILWNNGGSPVGAFTGKVSNAWAEPVGEKLWKVSLTAILPVSKSVTVDAESEDAAYNIAKQDKAYLTSDDWRYQGRPFSPAHSPRPPHGWSEEVDDSGGSEYDAPTITNLSIIPNPTRQSVATVLTAAVTSNGEVPTGTVTFYKFEDGAESSIGTSTLVNGHAELLIDGPGPGATSYTAHYNGNATLFGSASPIVDLTSEGGISPPLLDVDFTKLDLGAHPAATFLAETGLAYTCGSVVTCQTSETTIISNIPINAAAIGNRTSVQSNRGLVILPVTRNSIGVNAPRDQSITAGWIAGTGITTTNQIAGPDGQVLADRVTLTPGQYGNYAFGGDSLESTLSAWYKNASGTNGIQIAYTGTPAAAKAGLVSNEWTRIQMTKPAGSGNNFTFMTSEDYSSVGGESARSRDVYIDFVQYDRNSAYASEAMPLGLTPYLSRRLSHSNGASLIAASGQLKFYCKFVPMFASTMNISHWNIDQNSDTGFPVYWYLYSWGNFNAGSSGSYARIRTADRKLSIRVNEGTEVVSSIPIVFGQYDSVEIYIAIGNGLLSDTRYRVNGGGWTSFNLATISAVPNPGANPINLFMDHNSRATDYPGQPAIWLNRLTFYNVGDPA